MQTHVVWKPLPGSQTIAMDSRCDHTLYEGARGPGKQILDSTLVLTNRGWIQAYDVTMQDKLVAIDGTFTDILGIYPGYSNNLYEIKFDDGSKIVACEDHLWEVGNSKNFARDGWHVLSTKALFNKNYRHYGVPYCEAVDGKQWEGLDPYAIGLMLGDGTMSSAYPTLYSTDEEIISYMVNNFGWRRYDYDSSVCARASATNKALAAPWRALFDRRTAAHKEVPQDLMVADKESRLAVLQGLMDTDGSIHDNKCRFVSLSKKLAENVTQLVRSLGGKAVYYLEKRISSRGGANWRWRVNFSHRNKFNPFRLKRKAEKVAQIDRVQNIRYIINMKPVGAGFARCFAVAHERMCFVIQDYVVTHNSVTQLMRFLRHVGKGYGAFWRGIIFDLEFDHLSGLVVESKKWFTKFDDGAKFYESASAYKWVWKTGEELLFRHVKKIADYEGFHGHEYPFIGWNELTKYADSKLYDKFMSVNRSSFNPITNTPRKPNGEYLTPNGKPLPPIPLEVFSTTNPNGPGHNWVKRRFINCAPRGTVVRTHVEIFNPQTQCNETVTRTQIAIFGSYRENKYLPPGYIAELESIKDPNLRRAWLFGDWDVTAGGAIDDLWRSSVHVVPRFRIPSSWTLDRSYDDGSSHPFAVAWWAESDGTEAIVVLPDGSSRVWCPQPGSLIQIYEWYGATEIGTNVGLKLSAAAIAQGIIDREQSLMDNEWIEKQPYPGPADNRIRQVIDADLDTTEKLMLKKGVRWQESDKSPGSRIVGLQLLRDRLQAALDGEGAAIYFMQNCKASIELLPTLPRDPVKIDDVDTKAEDHMYDAVRYRVLKGSNRLLKGVTFKFIT